MELQKIFVNDYKSLVNLEIDKPSRFTVFAGPNGSGKSNIFEALEFASYHCKIDNHIVESLFGGSEKFICFNSKIQRYKIEFTFTDFQSGINHTGGEQDQVVFVHGFNSDEYWKETFQSNLIQKFYFNFSRVFINKEELNRIKVTANKRLLQDASNLSSVIKNILADNTKKHEFLEWLQLFIPGFENIEIQSDIDGNDRFHLFEKGTKKPFDKKLISDGTYNILSLLTAVYQSTEPQFLCIEEPENGLNPYVIKTLVDFFRKQCEDKGHYIWLNTHSQTLVKELQPQELILVDKIDGATQIKQFPKDYNLHGLTMDEAWLSNALGGGLPW